MDKKVMFLLGDRLKFLRAKYNFTQEELASRSKINVKHLQKLEGQNPSRANIESLQRLADAFEIPLWKLLKFEE